MLGLQAFEPLYGTRVNQLDSLFMSYSLQIFATVPFLRYGSLSN